VELLLTTVSMQQETHQPGEMKTTWGILVWVAPIIGLDISQKYRHWLSATLQNKYQLPKIMI